MPKIIKIHSRDKAGSLEHNGIIPLPDLQSIPKLEQQRFSSISAEINQQAQHPYKKIGNSTFDIFVQEGFEHYEEQLISAGSDQNTFYLVLEEEYQY